MTHDTFEAFKKHWIEEISKIEKGVLDDRGVDLISLHFDKDRLFLEMHIGRKSETRLELDNLESKLRVALELARSKYNIKHKGFWARLGEVVGGTAKNTRINV